MICNEIVGITRLSDYRENLNRALRLEAEILQIESKLGPSCIQISDMPRSQNPYDKLGNLTQRKIEKEKELQKITKKMLEEKPILEGVINSMQKFASEKTNISTLQDLLKYFYIDGFSVTTTCELLNCRLASEDITESKRRLFYQWIHRAEYLFLKVQKTS